MNSLETPLFGSYTLGIDFRPFQQKILDIVKKRIQMGEQKIHLVSPPGTGKTLMGLSIIEMLNQKAIVLCPNTTIQAQWLHKAKTFMVCLDELEEAFESFDINNFISSDPDSEAPILALTYQLFVAREDREKKAEPTFTRLIDRGYKTIVLDECHHLTGYWAEILHNFLHINKNTHIIGLTATPPFDRSEAEHRRFLSIVGQVDAEIPLPAVIKDGLLSPFQDLAYFVMPTEDEQDLIIQQFASIGNIIDMLASPGPKMDSLSLWVEQKMLYPKWRGKKYKDFITLSVETPQFTIALSRFAEAQGILLPPGCYNIEPVSQPLSLDDLALILEDYIMDHLRRIKSSKAEYLEKEIINRLGKAGYQLKNNIFEKHTSLLDKTLTLSSAKLIAMQKILIHEMQTMGEELRALVLTDFIQTHSPGEKLHADMFSPDAGGAIAAFRALISNKETDSLDPVLVTGRVILVDDEIKDKVISFSIDYLKKHRIRACIDVVKQEDFYILKGEGPEWNTKSYVRLLTEILHKGITRCIVGTRALFGEGWDCEPLNTLIDLTTVTSFVSVNQIRGRTLRLDPDNSAKTANNWDIVALLPDIIGGESDLNRFLKKHERFYGPTDDGDLEKGAGHVHPALTHLSINKLVKKMDSVNSQLLTWSADRARAFHTWKVGKPYRGEEISSLEILPSDDTIFFEARNKKYNKKSPKKTYITVMDPSVVLKKIKLFRYIYPALFFLFIFFNTPPAFSQSLFTLGLLGLFSWGLNSFINRVITTFNARQSMVQLNINTFIQKAAEVVVETLKLIDRLPGKAQSALSERADGSIRIKLENAPADKCKMFMEAMGELLSPYNKQRYLLTSYTYDIGFTDIFKFTCKLPDSFYKPYMTFPVPSILGNNKKSAHLFAQKWTVQFGPAEVEFVGNKQNKKNKLPILLPLSQNRPILKKIIHQLWR